MKFHAITDDETYAALLIDAETELSELIELVVVPETWLYRDAEAFAVATSVVQSRLQNQLGPVRILCLPCATGEEPYSLAMSLSDARIAPGDVTIEGVDISRAVVERAWRAVYGSNAFRTPDLDFRDRHFHEVEGGYALNARVRDMVTFRQVEDVRSPSIAAKNQLKGSRLVDNLAKKTADDFFPPSLRRWE
jgi:chemotaxis protein methyltransferase WspC